jgi:hypothetical protein
MISNLIIDEKNFKDIKILEDNEIEYLKNELEKIKIIKEYTSELLVDSNIKINKIEKENILTNINVDNKDLELAYGYKKKNILSKIYLSIVSIFTGLYLIIKR